MLCLTIDIDWAHDAVIMDTLELVERHDTKATWFVTHKTPVLAEIRAAGGHELGIHPNFNPLLDGKPGHAGDTIKKLMDIVPEAVSVRSHSLVRSSRLSVKFRDFGLTHESNYLLPPQVGAKIGAWRDFSGLIQVPIRWEDDVRLLDPSLEEPVDHLDIIDLLVVDIHPIHTFLNTQTIDDYETARNEMDDPVKLQERRRPRGCGGSRDRLLTLLSEVRARAMKSCRLGGVKVGKGG